MTKRAQRAKAANDDAPSNTSLPETYITALSDPILRSDLEHVVGSLIDLLDDLDGDPDRELSADDMDEEAD